MLSSALCVALLLQGQAPSVKAVPQEGANCELVTPEGKKGLDAVHAARSAPTAEAQAVVATWLPTTTRMLGSATVTPDWLHMAVDLGRVLSRLGNHSQARQLLDRVVQLDPDGEWGKTAAAERTNPLD
jgi:hypothetical protein